MENYTQLHIGKIYWSWKNDIPAFLTFLFDSDDFFAVWHEREAGEEEADDDYPDAIGFQTTGERAIAALERNGFSLDLCADVYGFFDRDLQRGYNQAIRQHLINADVPEEYVEGRVEEHLVAFPRLSKRQEVGEFIEFLKIWLSSDFNSPPFDKAVVLKIDEGREYRIPAGEYMLARRGSEGDTQFIDFERLQMYVLDKSLDFPPWVLKLCELFDWDYVSGYPEVISLVFLRLSLAAVDPRSTISLDLADIFDTTGKRSEQEQAIRNLHSELVVSLVEKVSLYGRVFKPLFESKERIRTSVVKAECRELLRQCGEAKIAAVKGRSLEALVEVLFTANHAFEVVNKRVSTGDEEIDIVVKNNIDRPFWNALQSPLFFVECKNWQKPVGAREIRDFEVKLRNHGALARVGFMVAIGGVTSEAVHELKRAGRDRAHLVIITGEDIEDFIRGGEEVIAWQEDRASVLH